MTRVRCNARKKKRPHERCELDFNGAHAGQQKEKGWIKVGEKWFCPCHGHSRYTGEVAGQGNLF